MGRNRGSSGSSYARQQPVIFVLHKIRRDNFNEYIHQVAFKIGVDYVEYVNSSAEQTNNCHKESIWSGSAVDCHAVHTRTVDPVTIIRSNVTVSRRLCANKWVRCKDIRRVWLELLIYNADICLLYYGHRHRVYVLGARRALLSER